MLTLTALEIEALLLSLKVAVLASALCLVPAIGVAWLLSRTACPAARSSM